MWPAIIDELILKILTNSKVSESLILEAQKEYESDSSIKKKTEEIKREIDNYKK